VVVQAVVVLLKAAQALQAVRLHLLIKVLLVVITTDQT
jgi:hypothetical protein